MMIDLNEDGRRKLHEICTKLGAHELLGHLTEELGEAIQAVMEVKEALGCTIAQEQAWKLDRMVRKCGELIQAAQKAHRAMKGGLTMRILKPGAPCACCGQTIKEGLPTDDWRKQ